VLFYADDDDDWTDETVWAKANPSLGHIINIESVREQCRRAQNSPQLENSFRRLRLNQWVKQENRYIPMSKWDECEDRPKLEEYRGEVFYAGLDLASSTDIAAFVAVHLDDQGNFNVFPYFWVPEEQIELRSRRDHVPYDVWVKQGYITATPGNVIDYEFIRHQMIDFGSEYELREVAYDRWGALQLMQQLEEDGLTVFPMGQGYASMSSPTKELLKIVLSQKLRHGGNPVLRWMADNLVTTSDPADNVKPDKSKSTERIDGMVALIMAIDRAIRHKDENTSVYEDEGMLVL
jgi:phage terminase large subunit-like protein